MNWKRLAWALCVLAVLGNVSFQLWPAWKSSRGENHGGRDFASYYYAVQVAAEGGDPYRTRELSARAREDGSRRVVHPFFYPPPFVMTMAWVRPMGMYEAFRAWFWADALCGAAAAGLLAWMWRRLGLAGPLAIGLLCVGTGVVNNHMMGQFNLPVLLVVLAACAVVERVPVLGGALLGLGAMWKMSPALLLVWWACERRWTAIAAACAAAVLLSVASLWLVPLGTQVRFYTEVLPGFASGDYNGLAVPISLFGNHSLPNVFDAMFPGTAKGLSSTARLLGTASSLLMLGCLVAAFRRPSSDAWQKAGRLGAMCTALLLPTVYTYEHHLVWALPAVTLVMAAGPAQRLPRWLFGLGLAAVVVWAWDLQQIKGVAEPMAAAQPVVSALLRESKMVSLLVLLVASTWVGAGWPAGDPQRAAEA